MTTTNWLPRFLRWVFAVFTVFMVIVGIALALLFVIDPKLPADAHFGPKQVEILEQPGTVHLENFTFTGVMLNGKLSLRVDKAGALVEVFKQYGIPLALLHIVFFGVIFDLLRRLFRNVGRSESFTQQNVRLVQIVGVSLLVFSLISSIAEDWFQYALIGYLAQHAVLTISGTPIHFPPLHEIKFSSDGGFPFGGSYFFSGLLVLALSEVFRQGLVLKRENDLTV